MGSRTEEAPSTRRVAVTAALAASAMVAAALPLRHIADVKPEVAGLVAADIRTKQRFDTALDRFNKGKTTAADVASVAAGTNVAELQAVDARLASLTHVPAEHEQLVRDAREYVRVRCDAWRLRADAVVRLHAPARASIDADTAGQRRLQSEARFRSNMKAAGRAEAAERTAAAAFDRLRDAAQLP
jgi:hypothetical protein